MEQPETSWYCVDCGVRLRSEHEFCWNCGARRWREPAATGQAEPEAGPQPVPVPAAPVRRPVPARRSGSPAPATVPGLGGVRFFLAFFGVLVLVFATYRLALLLFYFDTAAAPALQFTGALIAAAVVLAALHAVAYHGISGFRVGGWVVGVVVAGLWSLVLVGLPALYVLLLRTTREAFGLA